MARNKLYSSSPWKKVRLLVLERDNNLCKIRSQGCLIAATQVDHVIPVLSGGAKLDPRNLRAAYQPCNRGRVNTKFIGGVSVRTEYPGPSREWYQKEK